MIFPGQMLALRARARGCSALALVVYVCALALTLAGHQCCRWDPATRLAAAQPPGAAVTNQRLAHHAGEHLCIACVWQRSTVSTPAGLPAAARDGTVRIAGAVDVRVFALLSGAPLRTASRGPPLL